eukprot:11602631-Heterocapsa_arctica.AAC.1
MSNAATASKTSPISLPSARRAPQHAPSATPLWRGCGRSSTQMSSSTAEKTLPQTRPANPPQGNNFPVLGFTGRVARAGLMPGVGAHKSAQGSGLLMGDLPGGLFSGLYPLTGGWVLWGPTSFRLVRVMCLLRLLGVPSDGLMPGV